MKTKKDVFDRRLDRLLAVASFPTPASEAAFRRIESDRSADAARRAAEKDAEKRARLAPRLVRRKEVADA